MVSPSKQVLNLLTIAGSDSGGGAGIQADLKTFNSLEAYGLSVITAVTSQNTMGVTGVEPISASMVSKQLETVALDIEIDAIKTGMLHSSETIRAVHETLVRLYPGRNSTPILVIDPVMVSTSGHDLLEPTAVETLVNLLLPLATIVTPNVQEAILLAGWRETNQNISSLSDMKACARAITRSGTKSVLITGGHFLSGDPVITDVLYESDSDSFQTFCHPRIETRNTHGTGCTLSAALTAYLAQKFTVTAAITLAIRYVEGAMLSSFNVGKGSGPLNHHHNIIQRPLSLPSLHNPYPFTSSLIESCQDKWTVFTSTHRFLQGIKDGTLPRECFQHFLRQDYLFLTHYARIHSLMGFKCTSMDEICTTSQLVQEIVEESKLHVRICESWGVTEDELGRTEESNPTVAYTRYMMDIGFSKSLLHLRVATAPCLLGYGQMGLELVHDPATVKDGNPYWDWIKAYGGEKFQKTMRIGCDLLERSVREDIPTHDTLNELKKIFGKVVALEIDFWQMSLDCS
ncbi:hypothetical protein CROQUDRAFT_673654 [Cronartium quercuum f. sp. fusiforme G11]|uniref:Phosphomethylpyrimidine kinase n=1 Tax=Cronartium quercuum f. sp. fusiforme G11 TaxID=708437 RepID=A0A9P6NEG3_9BASI|nr:hypothetical protein CROQUDRAFT_673654 [Cronartium quercuum f. sp. fusiforme G11]